MTSETNEAGAISSMFDPNWRSWEKIATVIGWVSTPEGQRDEQVVPCPEELEDRKRGDRREPERQDQAQEDAHLRRPVDPRRFEELPRYPDEEVAQEEDRKREPERGVEQDQAEHRVEDPDLVVERENRDQGHLQRHNEERDDADEGPVAAREVEPGEGIAGERGDNDRQERAADRDPDGRQERVRMAWVSRCSGSSRT